MVEDSQVEELEEWVNSHREYVRSRAGILKENFQLMYNELKFKYENSVSTVDYLLGLCRQLFALAVTGYLGLMVVNPSTFYNVGQVKYILLQVIIITALLIVFFLGSRFYISKQVNEIIDERIKNIEDLRELEDKCLIFCDEAIKKVRNKEYK